MHQRRGRSYYSFSLLFRKSPFKKSTLLNGSLGGFRDRLRPAVADPQKSHSPCKKQRSLAVITPNSNPNPHTTMPAHSSNEAFQYAEWVRLRVPLRVKEIRLASGLSLYTVSERGCFSREMLRLIENGESIPTLHLFSRLAYGMHRTLSDLTSQIEEE